MRICFAAGTMDLHKPTPFQLQRSAGASGAGERAAVARTTAAARVEPVGGRWFGYQPATLKNWEQGRTRPNGPARELLAVIAYHPKAVEHALQKAG
jgi:hypothetical protein